MKANKLVFREFRNISTSAVFCSYLSQKNQRLCHNLHEQGYRIQSLLLSLGAQEAEISRKQFVKSFFRKSGIYFLRALQYRIRQLILSTLSFKIKFLSLRDFFDTFQFSISRATRI